MLVTQLSGGIVDKIMSTDQTDINDNITKIY